MYIEAALSSRLVDMRVKGFVDGAAALVHHVGLMPQSGDYFLDFFWGGAADVAVAWATGAAEDFAVAIGGEFADLAVGDVEGFGDVFCRGPNRALVVKKKCQSLDVIVRWRLG